MNEVNLDEPEPRLEASPDFEQRLELAFASPASVSLKGKPGVSSEDMSQRVDYYRRRVGIPDDVKIKVHGSLEDSAHVVYTDDPDQYITLLAQAVRMREIKSGRPDPGLIITPEIEQTATHEIAHGKMCQKVGIQAVKYGLRVLFDPEEKIFAISPFHNFDGLVFITKLEEAAIHVAPEDPSPGDLASIQAAGYKSREDVLERFYAKYPERK